ncbi:secreted RxLR effector protein 78-like [Silene latifolia]|uniref:secreted RxLR effector protein 78-like n=1 Tax=Silene latifolia TaxID=37657 RepID=UPI003D76D3CE
MFKIDLQKAYDTVEWCFVENLLEELHFPPEFKAMILQCITTTTFSLSINGEMCGYFQGKRGLRQGDPLSPLIFTFCMEYLTRTLQYASSKSEFKFHPMCKKQRLTSLMFADDVMLFSKGDANSMMLLLQSFATFLMLLDCKLVPQNLVPISGMYQSS